MIGIEKLIEVRLKSIGTQVFEFECCIFFLLECFISCQKIVSVDISAERHELTEISVYVTVILLKEKKIYESLLS